MNESMLCGILMSIVFIAHIVVSALFCKEAFKEDRND